jgi:uncharacterized protein (TIGR02266 family)
MLASRLTGDGRGGSIAVIEKRQFKRVPLNVAVEATAGGRTLRFESRNISVGGLLLRGDETLHENDTFQMKFRLPGRNEMIAATGVVQHVSPEAFMGVRFSELSEDVRRAIESYVKETPVPHL